MITYNTLQRIFLYNKTTQVRKHVGETILPGGLSEKMIIGGAGELFCFNSSIFVSF